MTLFSAEIQTESLPNTSITGTPNFLYQIYIYYNVIQQSMKQSFLLSNP
jgi:hypothetical protein